MTKDDFDLSTVDVGALTSGEYEAIKRRAIHRAHEERSRAARRVVGGLFSACRGRAMALGLGGFMDG